MSQFSCDEITKHFAEFNMVAMAYMSQFSCDEISKHFAEFYVAMACPAFLVMK